MVFPAKIDGDANTILARPLFSQARRPSPPPRLVEMTSGRLPRLSGIVIASADRRAIFEGEKPLIGRTGDSVGAYRIIAIRPTGVTVQSQFGIELLQVGFGGGMSRAGAAAVAGPNMLDRLNNAPPPNVPLPGRASLTQMLSRLPKPRG